MSWDGSYIVKEHCTLVRTLCRSWSLLLFLSPSGPSVTSVKGCYFKFFVCVYMQESVCLRERGRVKEKGRNRREWFHSWPDYCQGWSRGLYATKTSATWMTQLEPRTKSYMYVHELTLSMAKTAIKGSYQIWTCKTMCLTQKQFPFSSLFTCTFLSVYIVYFYYTVIDTLSHCKCSVLGEYLFRVPCWSAGWSAAMT